MSCGKRYYDYEQTAFANHVASHSLDEHRQLSFKTRMPAFFDNYHPDFNDVDWQRWIDRKSVERPEQWRKWMKTSEGKSTSGLGSR